MLFNFSKLALVVCVAALCAVAQSNTPAGPAPDVNAIVTRMQTAQQRNREQAHAITVKRDYQLLDHRQEQKAQVVAHITYMPPDQKQYTIESSYGGLGEKILRDVLEKETEQPRDPDRKELSTQNYDFQLLGSQAINGRQCYVLGLNPKRGDKDLIRGRVWVDSETYNVRRIEGNPAKNPSWWIHDLYILMSFAEVDGMWLRTFTYAVANVRFKGKYEMVSRDLEYHPATEQVVQRFRRRGRPGIITGAALNP